MHTDTTTARHSLSRGFALLSRCGPLLAQICFFGVLISQQIASADSTPSISPEAIPPEDLVAMLTDTLTSIDSLYCEWTRVELVQGGIVSIKRCRYARSGSSWHTTEFAVHDDGTTQEDIVCFDGEQAYAYCIFRSPDGSSRYGTVEVHDSQGESLLSVEFLIGMRLPSLGKSIPDVCREIEPTQITTGNGNQPFRLRLGSVPNSVRADGKVYAYDITCVLAPEYGMLPTVIHAEYAPQTKEFVSRPSWYQRWRVEDFALVEDELTRKERWFPFKGILEQGVGNDPNTPFFELQLTSVRINPTIDDTLFTPAVPAGTPVVDVSALGRGRVTLAGRGVPIDRRVAELSEAANSVDDRSSYLLLLLLGNLVVVALIMFFLWRTRST